MSSFHGYQPPTGPFQPIVYPPPHQPAHQPSTYNLPYDTRHGDYPDTRLPAAQGMPFGSNFSPPPFSAPADPSFPLESFPQWRHPATNQVPISRDLMMERFAIEILRTFATKSVHGQLWPKYVYAVAQYTINNNDYFFTARNISWTVHAEDGIINHLEPLLESGKLISPKIKLYLTYSPCHRCSQRIVNFLYTARWCHGVHLEFDIVFSAFYQVRRPSCEENPLCRSPKHLPSEEEHTMQVDGLTKLYRTVGVVLRPFKGPDWFHLKTALGVSIFDCRSRQEEDDLLHQDFEQILNLPYRFPAACCPQPLTSRFQDYQPPTVYPPQHEPVIVPSFSCYS